jgi:pullulanase/glycogen debranching enzyme
VISGTDLDTFTVKDNDVYVAMNFYVEPLSFKLPKPPNGRWVRIVDTYEDYPDDFCEDGRELTDNEYLVREKSIVVLINQ